LRLGAERLREARIPSAALDMSLILAEALGLTRLGLYLDLDRPLSPPERQAAREMLERRLRHEPIAYILGRREFYGLCFEVTPAVLVPRPETEHLVEEVIAWLNAREGRLPEPLLADIGTGCGAIAVAAAHAAQGSQWIATDVSAAALEVARRNARRHGVAERIRFRLGSLLEPLGETFDGLCANLPYVAEGERDRLAPDVARWEPPGALFSGPDGLELLRPMIAAAPARLRAGGLIALECGAGQAETVAGLLAEGEVFHAVRTINDLAGIGRVVLAERR
jgi:release factor glutamine methyltransferase